MEWLADPTAWLGLGTLIVLEVVLGVDNLIFIAVLVERLPPRQRDRARIIGLSLALVMRVAMLAGMSWLQSLTAPLFALLGVEFTGRGLILIAGGLFLLVKATTELHHRIEGVSAQPTGMGTASAFWQVIAQIVVIDAVFSIDSVVTAVGMVDHLAPMIIAVSVAILAMMLTSGPLTRLVNAHPSIVILCLSFLLMIGFSLFVEGFGLAIPKGYLYAAIAFSVLIEALNQVAHRRQVKRAAAPNLRTRTAEAVLRVLGGGRSGPADAAVLSSIATTGGATDVFAPSERAIVEAALSMADRPVHSVMTPARDVVWLNIDDGVEKLSRTILQTGHAAYPVCRGRFEELLGVALASDLIRDLLGTGRIAPVTLARRRPLEVTESESLLHLVERVRAAPVPLALVNDSAGKITGVISPTDLLNVLLGNGERQSS